MKKITALLLALSFILSSCSQMHTSSSSESTDAYVSFNLGAESRSIFPAGIDKENYTYILKGKISGASAYTTIGTYEGCTKLTEAFSSKIEITPGSWNFTLEALTSTGTVLSASTSKSITYGNNTVTFSLKRVTEGTGKIDVKLSLPSAEIEKVTARLYNTSDEPVTESTELTVTSGENEDCVEFTESEVECGNYILKFFIYQNENDTECINTVTEYVKVDSGCISSGALTSGELNTYHTIEYEMNGSSWKDGFTPVTKYNLHQSVTLPAEDELDCYGIPFQGWYTEEDFSGEVQTKIETGTASDKKYYAWFALICTADELNDKLSKITAPSVTAIITDTNPDCKVLNTAINNHEILVNLDLRRCTELTSITNNAFNSGTYLSSVTLPDSVTGIGKYAFSGCKNLTSINITNCITSIGNYAFEYCSILDSSVDLSSITEIGEFIFYNCKKISSIAFSDKTTSIGSWAFAYTGLTSVTIPETVKTINSCAFRACPITSITIPASVKTLSDGAFEQCSLTSVTVPNTVTTLGKQIFYGCSSLTSVNVNCAKVGEAMFKGCNKLKDITLQPSVSTIGEEAFSGCTSLKTISITGSVGRIEKNTFSGCTSLASISLPKTVLFVGMYAFRNCKKLTSISFVNLVQINSYAFENCTSLASVELADKLTTLEDYAFKGCTALKNITLPSTITYMDTGVFYGCTSLSSVTLPDKINKIPSYTFEGCTSLASVTVPDNFTSIGFSVFEGCTGLTSITLPDSITSISSSVFKGCTGLTSITLPDSITSINSSVFKGCTALASIEIPSAVTAIWDSAFEGCTSLSSVTIPENASQIGANAFSGCTMLQSITFSDPETWYYTSSSSYTNGTEIDVTDASVNATALANTYAGCYFYKE